MRQITLDGRIGTGGAKVVTSASGTPFVRFSLANDSYVNGTNKTEWFEISCFDPFVLEKRVNFLTQGRYVIVQGTINSEVTNKAGKIYLNHYVRALNIETPSIGAKKDENQVAQVSTFTGGTKSAEVVKPQAQAAPVQEAAQPVVQVAQPAPQPQPVVSQAAPAGWTGDEDLPF